jgi:deoxyribodipyrimidine photo-lyase
MTKYNITLFIFHRSLRLNDNKGLLYALQNSKFVIPIFIFTPEQITTKNKFRSEKGIKFMMDSLEDLNNELKKYSSKLYIYYGKFNEVFENILNDKIEAIICNKDYTKYAVERSNTYEKIAKQNNIDFIEIEDYLLHNINTIKNIQNSYYSKFTPFYNNAVNLEVEKPKINKYENYIKKYSTQNTYTIKEIKELIKLDNKELIFEASREQALKQLNKIKKQEDYGKTRNDLTKETTLLSPYIKFGLLSIREVYHKIKSLFEKKHDLIKQLYWREFYYNISYNRQDIFEKVSFKVKFDNIKWNNNEKLFKLWKEGKTGYPIVDAGMRELNETGYMHNRTRLITSNFLVKHLFIDWRKGEQYYATKLIDYDPSVNNGNWQFSSSSGADSQPYFRMMNPITQGEKHDPECIYIKKWIKELENISCDDIHNWQKVYNNKEYKNIYYPPCKIYDFKKLKIESKKIFNKAFN